MFIAHAPAGYLVGRWLAPYVRLAISLRTTLIAAVIGGVLPDFDLVYFYAIDHRQQHHHRYWTHWPLTWLGLMLIAALGRRLAPTSRIAAGGFVVAVSAFGHLLLDSIVGDIWWFAPAVDQPFSLLSVRPQWQPWWLNFLLHPVMVLELAIIAVAVRVARRPRAGTGVSPDAADVRRDRR